ncbi:hypothetical protein HPB52_000341 [Rhipicephalus sanguineus]|uniref:Myb/SANT-like DNA-binding domain-containing protein n=1 Tax=Rhipicephalus sanguineus TaxID=34632 RepID=A0A9D4T4T5_RHISA|nr:hypothetical protein HPB52_000341 [Rhipicephalus sanguineus]
MSVVAEIDGVSTELYPIVDELGVIMLDGDAELYATADGRTLRVVCASGRLTGLTTADPTNGRATPATAATPTTPQKCAMQSSTPTAAVLPQTRARCDDSEEALWSGRRTRFLIQKYKQNFGNIGKKGGLRNKKQLFLYLTDAVNEEFECALSVVQVTNKWKSLARAYKRARENNKKSGSGTAECRFEEEMSDLMEKQHHVSPIVTYTQGRKMVREDRLEKEPEATVEVSTAPVSQESSAEGTPEVQEVQQRRSKDPPLVQLLRKLDEIEKNRAARHAEKMALFERFVSAYEAKK